MDEYRSCFKCKREFALNIICCISFTKGWMYFCKECSDILNPKIEASTKKILHEFIQPDSLEEYFERQQLERKQLDIDFIQPERLSEKTLINRQEIKNDI